MSGQVAARRDLAAPLDAKAPPARLRREGLVFVSRPRPFGETLAPIRMTPDQFLQNQLQSILTPGERVLHTAYMRKQPGLLWQILILGALLLFWLTRAYFVVLTDRRMILIETKMGFWTGGPQLLNLGVESIDARAFREVRLGGIANNRSMTFVMADGSERTLRIAPWFKQVQGTSAFFEQVPGLIHGGQLAQLAAAPAPSFGSSPGGASPVQGGFGSMGAPPASPAFAPGTRVSVLAPDGLRYPGTVVHAQGGQLLCAMPDGQQHWVPEPNVGPA